MSQPIKYLMALASLALPLMASANTAQEAMKYPFYVGGVAGFGTTTWKELVNRDTGTSTPIHAEEGGVVWGALVGYQVEKNLAVELHYIKMPSASINFASFNYYNNIIHMTSRTEYYSAVVKVMAPLFRSGVNLYVSAGVARGHRHDVLAKKTWRWGGAFGAGFNYNITPHILAELGFQLYTGNGKSEVKPVDDYMPFAYMGTLQIAYRFAL